METPRGTPSAPKLEIVIPVDTSPHNWKLRTDGLPAVSADGRRAAVVVDQPDGGRGYPNSELAFVAVDTDRVEKKVPLFVADEFSSASDVLSATEARTLASKVERRLERARAELAKTNWISLAYTRESAPVSGVDVSLGSGRLRVRDVSSSALLLDHNARAWTARPHEVPHFASCTYDAALALIAVDTTRRTLVVVVSQTPSGDPCEAPSVAHAVRMKP